MREFGFSKLESRRDASGLFMVAMGLLVKGGLSEESGLQQGRRDEGDLAAWSRRSLVNGIVVVEAKADSFDGSRTASDGRSGELLPATSPRESF